MGRRLAILPGRLVVLLDELQERGLIERRQDPADRRTYALHLTAAGRNTMEQIGRIAREHDDATCAAVNAEKKKQLNALLTRIAVDSTPLATHLEMKVIGVDWGTGLQPYRTNGVDLRDP